MEAYPGGNLEVDKRNRTPLHFALCNVDCPATEFLTECLVRPFEGTSAATIADENDMLPIHYGAFDVSLCVHVRQGWTRFSSCVFVTIPSLRVWIW